MSRLGDCCDLLVFEGVGLPQTSSLLGGMQSRRRGQSFYEEGDEDPAEKPLGGQAISKEETPAESASKSDMSVNLDDDLNFGTDEEEEEEFPQVRGRSRSKSLCSTDSPYRDQNNNVTVNEDSGSTAVRGEESKSCDLGSQENVLANIPVIPNVGGLSNKRSSSAERNASNPLTRHEVLVLQEGLQNATVVRDPQQVREEEEEKIAAKEEEEERLVRAGKINSAEKIVVDTDSASSTPPYTLFEKFPSKKESTSDKSSSSQETGSEKEITGNGNRVVIEKPKVTVQEKYTMGSENQNTRRFKILLLGDSGVGKSSLMLRWTEDKYSATLTGTVGVNFKSKKVSINNENVQVQVWDTAGQQQFHKITTSYYRGAHGIMVVYDVSDSKSLANVEYWIKNIKSHAAESVQVTLIGNKTDLRKLTNNSGEGDKDNETDKNRVSDDTDNEYSSLKCSDSRAGKEIAERFNIDYFETSALDASGTDSAFMNLSRSIIAHEDGNPILANTTTTTTSGKPDAAKTSMISRMMGRGGNSSNNNNNSAPPSNPTAKPVNASEKDMKDKKKCTIS